MFKGVEQKNAIEHRGPVLQKPDGVLSQRHRQSLSDASLHLTSIDVNAASAMVASLADKGQRETHSAADFKDFTVLRRGKMLADQ